MQLLQSKVSFSVRFRKSTFWAQLEERFSTESAIPSLSDRKDILVFMVLWTFYLSETIEILEGRLM
jgi:hypothetical protein